MSTTLSRFGKKFRPGTRCPDCGSLLSHVTDTRPRDGRIWRRRLCSGDHRYTTWEVSVEKIEKPLTPEPG